MPHELPTLNPDHPYYSDFAFHAKQLSEQEQADDVLFLTPMQDIDSEVAQLDIAIAQYKRFYKSNPEKMIKARRKLTHSLIAG